MGHDEQDVVLTLPTRPEFGDVARLAVGELARRRGFTEWEGLERAVTQTLRLLQQTASERVRFTFALTPQEIAVEAELTDERGHSALSPNEAARLRAALTGLVEHPEVDAGVGRISFRKLRD